jgi:hypothetical protein
MYKGLHMLFDKCFELLLLGQTKQRVRHTAVCCCCLCVCLFAHLRRCLQVLQELASDKGLERFRIEYEKLYRALKKSHGKFQMLTAAVQRLMCVPAPNVNKHLLAQVTQPLGDLVEQQVEHA